jgi:hypothetical protein
VVRAPMVRNVTTGEGVISSMAAKKKATKKKKGK